MHNMSFCKEANLLEFARDLLFPYSFISVCNFGINCGRITKLIMQQLHYASQYEILGSKVVMFPITKSVLEFPARKYEIDQILHRIESGQTCNIG